MDIDSISLFNQRVWDANPERAKEVALHALHTGGFDSDCIERQVGNYEGQIMAIQRGWAVKQRYGYRITADGLEALRSAGRDVPALLPARDDWHSRIGSDKQFHYCAYEIKRDGRPMLKLFKDAIASGADWGMDPVLRREDAIALRDYLDDWLGRLPSPAGE